MCFLDLRFITDPLLLLQVFTPGSSWFPWVASWSPAGQMSALRRCSGKQPHSGSHALVGSTPLLPGTHPKHDFSGKSVPCQLTLLHQGCAKHSSKQPPGKTEGTRESQGTGTETQMDFKALLWYWLSRGTKLAYAMCWVKSYSSAGGLKAKPKCLAVIQPDFGSGWWFKLAFHFRHSQQMREHKGEHS